MKLKPPTRLVAEIQAAQRIDVTQLPLVEATYIIETLGVLVRLLGEVREMDAGSWIAIEPARKAIHEVRIIQPPSEFNTEAAYVHAVAGLFSDWISYESAIGWCATVKGWADDRRADLEAIRGAA